MKPELFVNWASENAGTLDNIKLKKTIKLLLIRFTGTLAYNLHSKAVSYKLNCKDVLFNGKITLDPQAGAIDYRKRFSLPVIGNKLGCFVAKGRWAFNDISQTWDPSFRVGFEFRQGSAELVSPTTIRFKPRIFFKNIGLEARTLLTLHLPSKLLFELANGSDSTAVRDDDDTLGLNLEVQQLDLVLRL